MEMGLLSGEPAAGPWRAVNGDALREEILAAAGNQTGRPRIVSVDGRGGSGKSTLADFLGVSFTGASVVRTDDVAWHEPFFAWGELLSDNVLRVLHAGHGVHFRPPQWQSRGREGAIEVAPTCELVIIEGVGANQHEFADLIDATIWVQADFAEAERRGIARDIASGVNGDATQSTAFWHEWMNHEIAFFDRQRPWQRADLVVAGTPVIDLAEGQWAVASGPLRV